MNYREVYRRMCALAADHLHSLEPYDSDEFGKDDEERVFRALEEIQEQLRNKSIVHRRGRKIKW